MFRGRVSKLLRDKKRSYLVHTLNANITDPKGFLKKMGKNLHIGKHKPSTGCSAIRSDDGQIVTEKRAADVMNRYYGTMGSNLAGTFSDKWAPSQFFNQLNVVPSSFEFVSTEIMTLCN